MPAPVKVILDTDMGAGGCSDADDVGTIGMLNAMADNGEVELLAIMLNTMANDSAKAISVLQQYYGRDHVPIGVYKGDSSHTHLFRVHPYIPVIANGWPSRNLTTAQLPSATDIYRQILGAEVDNSVVVVSVGVLTNLAELLRSGPDAYSSLNGTELLSRKAKLLAVMGGRYPEGEEVCIAWNTASLHVRLPRTHLRSMPLAVQLL